MIDSVMVASNHLQVSGGMHNTMYCQNFNSNSHGQVTGSMRYNPLISRIEVFDGNTWSAMPSSSAMLDLAPHVKQIVDWATKKMQQEQQREELANNNAAFRDILNQLHEVEQKVSMVQALIKT